MARYQHSNQWFDKAASLIPIASQTFSKSHYSLPRGGAPLFLERGKGSRVWDLDGNEYVDLVNGLLSILLGYGYEPVDQAIRRQLEKGISFSLPHRLEAELAERLVNLIPSAEMVRFGKNGTDATSAAIRLARAVTGREHIAVCGYHGWQDWYIGSTSMHLGVPQGVQGLTHTFPYNDLDALQKLMDTHPLACVMMEPMNYQYPEPGYLEGVRALCDQHGTLLVFDETITGFRFHVGGAQTLFGVTPDLSTFGKGMGNGMPISAIVGRREWMAWMERIFFSGTFGGETLSLAASLAVIDELLNAPVLEHLARQGSSLNSALEALCKRLGVEWLSFKGHPSWQVFAINTGNPEQDLLYKSALLEKLADRGVLTIGSHNLSYSVGDTEMKQVVQAYSEALEEIVYHIGKGTLCENLKGAPLIPVFKTR